MLALPSVDDDDVGIVASGVSSDKAEIASIIHALAFG